MGVFFFLWALRLRDYSADASRCNGMPQDRLISSLFSRAGLKRSRGSGGADSVKPARVARKLEKLLVCEESIEGKESTPGVILAIGGGGGVSRRGRRGGRYQETCGMGGGTRRVG